MKQTKNLKETETKYEIKNNLEQEEMPEITIPAIKMITESFQTKFDTDHQNTDPSIDFVEQENDEDTLFSDQQDEIQIEEIYANDEDNLFLQEDNQLNELDIVSTSQWTNSMRENEVNKNSQFSIRETNDNISHSYRDTKLDSHSYLSPINKPSATSQISYQSPVITSTMKQDLDSLKQVVLITLTLFS